MKLRILWVLFVCMTVHACVLLPIPHRRPLSPVFWGSVIDADSQEPITNARIVVVDRFRGGTMTDSSDDAGQYEVGVTERATWFVIWPPLFEGRPDPARMHWLTHPAVDAAELRLPPDLAALVATRRFPG